MINSTIDEIVQDKLKYFLTIYKCMSQLIGALQTGYEGLIGNVG